MGPRRRRGDSDPTTHIGILDDAEDGPRKKRAPVGKNADEPLDLDDIW